MRMNKVDRDKIINTIAKRYVDQKTVTSQEVADISNEFGFDYLPYSVLKDARASRGNFYVAKLMKLAGVTAPAKVVDFPTPKEPVVVPVPQESGSGTTKQPSGGIFPGGGQSIPKIRPTDFNNNYVYQLSSLPLFPDFL